MPITIGANIASIRAQRSLGQTADSLSRVQERLSSGQRINRASDDAAGLSIASILNAHARILDKGMRNINDSISAVSISESAMSALGNITIRQRELAEQSANGTYTNKQRLAIDAESRALTNEYNRVVLTTDFNGLSLFNNSWEELRTQFGVGDANAIGFNFADDLATKVTPGSYFTIDGISQKYYVWYTIDGQGTDPMAEGTGLRVDLFTSTTEGVHPATTGVASMTFGDASAEYSAGDSIYYVSSPSSTYYLWFNVDGFTFDPGDTYSLGATPLEVTLTSSDNAYQVATAAASVLAGTGEFSVVDNGDTSITITNLTAGLVRAPAQGYVHNVGDVSQLNSGSNLGSDSQTITGDQVRDAVRAALDATGSFTTQVKGDGSLWVTNSSFGRSDGVRDSSGNLLIDPLSYGGGRQVYSTGDGAAFYAESGDLNGDGILDILSGNNAGTVTIRLGVGDGTFSSISTVQVLNSTWEIHLGDFNRDGKLDLVATGEGGNLSYSLGNGDGTFGAAQGIAVGGDAYAMRAIDVNRDGYLDFVTANYTSNSVNINLGNGNGTFKGAKSYSIGAGSYDISLADLNGDGKLDIATADYALGRVSISLGNGDGSFKAATSFLTATGSTHSVALADLNNDGRVDLVTTGYFSGKITVHLGNGDGTFLAGRSYAMGNGPRLLSLADMNGDGLMDVLTPDAESGTVSIRLGNGDGTFRALTSYYMGDHPGSLKVADFNQDGQLDVLADNYGDTTQVIRYGIGGGRLEADARATMRLLFGDARGMTRINHVDLSTRYGARQAMAILDSRLTRIENQIASFGAAQSRLASAARTVASSKETFLGAESRIKDADIGAESAQYVKVTIMQQAAIAVLTQANLAPQLALSLLRG